MIFNKNKKGELTTKQLVTIIILIASFVIILFLLFRLNPGEVNNKEICHNSVVLKEKSGVLAGPLDCRTNYLCISGGGNCEEIPTKSTIKVDPGDKDEIMQAITDEMSDCWWMFGEGEINYEKGFLEGKVNCALCSVVAFDEKVQGKIPTITQMELYSYLKKTAKTNSQTYLQYLYDMGELVNINDEGYFGFDLNNDVIDTSQKQSIFTGVDMNLLGKDKYLNTFIIPTSETSLTKCQEYITKA